MEKKLSHIMNDNSRAYASYVALHRAIPSLVDGLKPSHLRILYTMHKMKATENQKSANIEGQVMRIHPHGGTYPTLVGMAQEDGNLTPFIAGKGNFGQHTSRDMAPGAPRYTEARLAPIAIDTFKNISKGGVEFIDNYDGTQKIPTTLPVDFPSVLHFAQSGIGFGIACSVPSFNLGEICDATVAHLRGEEIPILLPDFATGALVVDDQATLSSIHLKGSGSLSLYAKGEVSGQEISITEIPYSTTREQIIEGVLKGIQEKKLPEIKDIRDLTGRHGMLIEIECKRGVNAQEVFDRLVQEGYLKSTYPVNMNVLGLDGLPKVMGVKAIIEDWSAWKVASVKKEVEVEAAEARKKAFLLSAVKPFENKIDSDLIPFLRQTKGEQMYEKGAEVYGLAPEQIDYLLKLPLGSLNQDNFDKKMKEAHEAITIHLQLENALTNEEAIKEMVIKRILAIKDKYNKPRRTAPMAPPPSPLRKKKERVVEISFAILTKQGFVYKFPKPVSLEQVRLAPGDEILEYGEVSDLDYVASFEGADVKKIYFADLKPSAIKDLGHYVSEAGHQTIVTQNTLFLLVHFATGKTAKIAASAYATKAKRAVLKGASGGEVVRVKSFDKEQEVTFVLTKGEYTVNTSTITTKKTKGSAGVWVKKTAQTFN